MSLGSTCQWVLLVSSHQRLTGGARVSGLTEKRKKGLGVIRPELFKRPREAQLGISARLGLRLTGRPDRVAPEKGWLGSRLRAGSILARAMVKRAGSGPFQQRLPSYFPSPSLQLTRQPHGAAVPPSLPSNGSRGSVTPRIRRGRAPSRAAHPVRGRLCGRSPERRQLRRGTPAATGLPGWHRGRGADVLAEHEQGLSLGLVVWQHHVLTPDFGKSDVI